MKNTFFRKINRFFDLMEDKVRSSLSHRPIIYTLIGGIGVVLFWRGVWMIADSFTFMTGIISFIISVVILLVTGLFVSFFIGDNIIIAGLKKEKKLVERTETELHTELEELTEIKKTLQHIQKEIAELKQSSQK